MLEFICSLSVISSIFTACVPTLPVAAGYVEGDYVLISPNETTRIEQVLVGAGDRVEPDQIIVEFEKQDAQIRVAQARATLARAKSEYANLRQGRRPEEIAVIEAAKNAAMAQHEEARRRLNRQEELLRSGITSQASYDNALTQFTLSETKLLELQANLDVAKLPARSDEISAAKASVDEAQAALDIALWQLEKRTLVAEQAGLVTDILLNRGEMAMPQAPVVVLLPDDAITVRFYVEQAWRSRTQLGQHLDIKCDGCEQGLEIEVNYISDEPEFTPPVIYSIESRQKLVYLFEAAPIGKAAHLRPGQIVDVFLPVR